MSPQDSSEAVSAGQSEAVTLDGGEALLQACRDIGADYIFSSPGSEWAPVWEALARAKRDGIDSPAYYDLTHETLAVGMATGYTVVSGRPQVVLLHAAAGLLQGANAIHGALLAGASMVVCSGESTGYGDAAGPDPGSQWYRNLSIVGGPQQIATPFTKWSNEAADVGVVRGMVARAAEIAAAAPAGPVYVNVPVEVLLAEWTPIGGHALAPRAHVVASDEDLAAAMDMLRDARRPVIITEAGGRTPEQFESLVAFAEALGAPVVEPQSAICSNFPRSHPLHAGGDAASVAKDADLVVLVNCRAPWYPPSAAPQNAKTLVIDEVAQRPHIAYQILNADRYVGGETAAALNELAQRLAGEGIARTATATERVQVVSSAHTEADAVRLAAEAKAATALDLVDPIALVAALREAIPADAIVVDETITHSRLVAQHLAAETAGRYHYVQGGLGQGTGVALGVKLAVSERMVVLTIGDGALLYNPYVQALMAAKTLGLPLLVVVFTNDLYLSMKFNHLRAYPKGAAVETQTFYGVSLDGQPDPTEIAEACGVFGRRVETVGELDKALEQCVAKVAQGESAVLTVHVSR